MYPRSDESPLDPQVVANVAAAFQEALVEFMVRRTIEAVKRYGGNAVLLGGGVAANSRLRQQMTEKSPVPVMVPRPALCTDNGAMIGAAAYFHLRHGMRREWDLDVVPNLRLG